MMLKQQLTQEEAATLSVVYDAETTTHTKFVTLSVVYNAETTTQSCYTNHVAETVRMQILLMKQPMICDAEIAYNNKEDKYRSCYSSRNNNTSLSTFSTIVIALCYKRPGYLIPV
jgi:hypothetical protein